MKLIQSKNFKYDVLIAEHNPFGFRDEYGEPCYYPSYYEAYLELMRRLYMYFFGGYIDMALFLYDNCGLKLDIGSTVTRKWRLYGYTSDPCEINWKVAAIRDRILEAIARGMHDLTETPFKAELYKIALTKFKLDNNYD